MKPVLYLISGIVLKRVAPDLEDDVITRVAHAVAAALRPAT